MCEKFNSSCLCSDESAIDDSDCLANKSGDLTHTWQAQNSHGSSGSCAHSYECDCDDLHLTSADAPSIKANVSLRAVANYCFNNAYPYEYEILDIQASPHTGHIMHPPDRCLKHNKSTLQSR